MSQSEMILYGVPVLAVLAIVMVGLLLTGDNAEQNARKRAKLVGEGNRTGTTVRKGNDEAAQRRKETQRMLTKLREDGAERKKSLVPQDIKTKIEQAGLSMSPLTFWVGSAVLGIVLAGLAYMSEAEGIVAFGMDLKSRPAIVIASGLAGFLGVPRWILNTMAKKRAAKLTAQFADGIDIIVRGVKSGLPLNECLKIIARESPDPLGPEFAALTDNLAMGAEVERALQDLYNRVPLPEINFFVIVLTIQAKAGVTCLRLLAICPLLFVPGV